MKKRFNFFPENVGMFAPVIISHLLLLLLSYFIFVYFDRMWMVCTNGLLFFFLQVYTGQMILRTERVISARSFAKSAGSAPPALKGDGESKHFDVAMIVVKLSGVIFDFL